MIIELPESPAFPVRSSGSREDFKGLVNNEPLIALLSGKIYAFAVCDNLA